MVQFSDIYVTTTVSPTPNSQLEQEIKELRERLNKTEAKQAQQETRITWLVSTVNSISSWFNIFLTLRSGLSGILSTMSDRYIFKH